MKCNVTLKDLVKELNLRVLTCQGKLDREISGGYASDLLSDVLANSNKDNIWITLQIHQNIVGVASMKEHVGIIIVNGREPEQETLLKAESESIPIMVTSMSTFDIVGKLYSLGIRSKD
jgi:serine kinase of HPr protein (carbohydrate metabolism regulator)